MIKFRGDCWSFLKEEMWKRMDAYEQFLCCESDRELLHHYQFSWDCDHYFHVTRCVDCAMEVF